MENDNLNNSIFIVCVSFLFYFIQFPLMIFMLFFPKHYFSLSPPPNFISRQNANILPCLTVERFFLVGFAYFFFFLSFWLKMEVSFLQILFQTQLSILFGVIFFSSVSYIRYFCIFV